VQGSTTAFVALHRSLTTAKKVAICRLIGKRGGVPKFVGLQPVNVGDDLVLNMVYLPYNEDIRKPHYDKGNPPPSDEQVAAAKKLVGKLVNSSFTSRTIPNPSLQSHYRAIEALAFQRDEVAGFDDETKVDDNDLAMVAEQEIKEAVVMLLPEDYDPFAKLKKP